MYARRGIYLLVRDCYFFMLLRYYIIYCLLHIVFLTAISRLGGWYFTLQEPFTSNIFAYPATVLYIRIFDDSKFFLSIWF